AFETFKYAGVAYLLFMAWQALKERGALKVARESNPRPPLQVMVHAILINVLNPKLSIFFFAFLPQFVSPHETRPLTLMLTLSIVVTLLTLVDFGGSGLFAAAIRDRVLARPRVMAWMRPAFAAALVPLGVKLALAAR